METRENSSSAPKLDKDKSLSALISLHFQNDVLATIRPKAFFTLLLGPSTVGKSTLIRAMNAASGDRFKYISPFTTRPLREGEQDKISVSDEEFDEMQLSGVFVYVNPLYGVRYGTSRTNSHSRFPLR